MKRCINLVQLTVLFAIVLSCSKQKSNSEEQPISISIVDSVKVAHLGQMMLSDISPSDDYFLTVDYQKSTYYLISTQGEILQQYQKSGDTPDAFGFAFSEMGFWDDESVFIIGSKAIKWYDLNGHEIKSTPKNPDYQLGAIMRFTGGQPKILNTNDGTRILHQGGPVLGKRTEPDYFDKFRGGTLINPANFEVKHLFPLEKDSRFYDGKYYDNGDLYARLSVGKEYIYLTFDGNPVLYAYHKKEPFELAFKKNLSLNNVNLSEGMNPEFVDYDVFLDASKGGLRNLQTDDDHIYLMYFEGIPKDRLTELDQLYEIDEVKADVAYEEEISKREKRLKIFDLEGNEKVDILLPKHLDSYWGFISKDGFLYFNKAQNMDTEEDYFTIYKIKIDYD